MTIASTNSTHPTSTSIITTAASFRSSTGLSDAYPVLLLPLRLETRFLRNQSGQYELWVRVYPDQVAVDAHQLSLTDPELKAGKRYQTQVGGSPPPSEVDRRSAWRELARRFGPARAAWIAKTTIPSDRSDQPRVRGAEEGWLMPPKFMGLPERFVVFAYQDGELFHNRAYPGNLVRRDITLLAPGPGGLFDECSRWMVDRDRAEKDGMAVRIPVTPSERGRGFSRIIVVGLQPANEDSSATLAHLIDSHHYATGLGFLPYGTPTNNTGTTRSGHAESTEDREGSYDFEILDPVGWTDPTLEPRTSAGRLGRALGLGASPALLRHLAHAGDTTDSYAKEIQTALWPVTGEYLLRYLLPGVVSDQGLADLGHHFAHFVRAVGPLPALRVGDQPYGILPVTSVRGKTKDNPRGWEASPSDNHGSQQGAAFDNGLHSLLCALFDRWLSWAHDPDRVPRIGVSGDPDRQLLQILAMMPASVSYASRPFVDERFTAWLLVALRDDVFGPGTPYAALNSSPVYWVGEWARLWNERRHEVAQFWQQLSGVPVSQLEAAPLLRLLSWWNVTDLAQPLVYEDGPRQPEAPLPYLAALCSGATPDPQTLLCDLFNRYPKLAEHSALDPAVVHTAICSLKDLPASSIERLFREPLDLCTHRLDAWISSLATKRLDAMRQDHPNGIYLGAYGWVEDLREGDLAASAGYIHAPSRAQAAAAAVLHSAYLTHEAGSGTGLNPYAVNLNSERVRRALAILDGARQGQPLGALLGYQFERGLYERSLDRYIDDFRAAFPLAADQQDEPDPGASVDSLAARNVVDGLALARWRADPQGADVTPPDPRTLARLNAALASSDRDALGRELAHLQNSLDAVGDLLLCEGVYQAVQGNFERSGAALDAAAGNACPPEIESVATPVAGMQASQRACLLFPPATSADLPKQSGPRDLAEPSLAAWLGSLLGDLRQIGCGFKFRSVDANGKEYVRVNLNAASAAELSALPGIGPVRAAAIVANRQQFGAFKRIGDLQRVSGIWPSAIRGIRPLVTTGKSTLDIVDLGLGVLDLLYLSTTASVGGGTELTAWVRCWVRSEFGLTHTTAVDVDCESRGKLRHCVSDALELSRQVLRMLGAGSPLRPGALSLPGAGDQDAFLKPDVQKLAERVVAARTTLAGMRDHLVRMLITMPAPEDLLAALVAASRYGVPGALPAGLDDPENTSRLQTVVSELNRRLDECAKLMQQVEAATELDRQVALWCEAMRMLFGRNFIVLPVFTPGNRAELAQAFAQPDLLAGLDEERVRLWLAQAALVHEPLRELEDTLLLAGVWREPLAAADAPPLTLRVAQLSFDAGNRWLGLDANERPSDYDAARDRGALSIVAAFGAPLGVPVLAVDSGSGPARLAGLLLDQWDELVPSVGAETGVSFQYDGPSAQAPQCLLLAVPAQRGQATAPWTVEDLAAIVYDTLDLAKVRAVDLDAMAAQAGPGAETSAVGWALPGLLLPRDPAHPGYERTTPFQTIGDWLKVIAPS